MRSLEQCLIDSDPERLEAIASRWGLNLPRRRSEAAAALAAHIAIAGALQQAWEELPPDEQAALLALQAAGGSMPWATFARRWGQVRAMGPGRLARERPWENPATPSEGLWYRGLLFRTFVEGPAGLYEVALLPSELQTFLPTAPTAPAPTLAPVAPPPDLCPADDHLLDDACTLLAYLQNRPLRPGPQDEWPAGDETRLSRQFRGPAAGRLALLRHLAQRLNWLRADRNGLLRPDPETVTAWLQAASGEQRMVLARAWRDSPAWNDLWHVPSLQPEDTGSWSNDPLLARQAILRHLAACRPGEWYILADLVDAIHEAAPDFQRPDGNYSTWYIRDAHSGHYLSGFAAWDAVEGALIRYVVGGPLAWLGLLDLDSPFPSGDISPCRERPPSVFRLNTAGAAFLGLPTAPPPADAPPPLILHPDATVHVPTACRYERFQLSRVANWLHSGEPYVYRLTPDSLQRARQQKITPQRITAFLEQASGAPLPRSLQAAIDRWTNRGSQVQLKQTLLLCVEDEALLQELAQAPGTRRWIRQIVGPTTAVVNAADGPRLIRALVEQGILPDVIDLQEPLSEQE